MSVLTTYSELFENVETVLDLYIKARDAATDEEWDVLQDHPLLNDLLCALADLEHVAG